MEEAGSLPPSLPFSLFPFPAPNHAPRRPAGRTGWTGSAGTRTWGTACTWPSSPPSFGGTVWSGVVWEGKKGDDEIRAGGRAPARGAQSGKRGRRGPRAPRRTRHSHPPPGTGWLVSHWHRPGARRAGAAGPARPPGRPRPGLSPPGLHQKSNAWGLASAPLPPARRPHTPASASLSLSHSTPPPHTWWQVVPFSES